MERYRALCLIAWRSPKRIRRSNDRHPGPALSAGGGRCVAPRARGLRAVRHRVLPTVVRSLYASSKAAYDRKAFAEAADGLDKTVRLIDNLKGSNQEFGDLRMLASGFLDLSKAADCPSRPVLHSRAHTRAGELNPVKAPVALVPAPPLPFFNVVAKRQDLPSSHLLAATKGLIPRHGRKVEINEAGNVVGARVIQSVHVLYDPLLLVAARNWKYSRRRRLMAGRWPAQARRHRAEALASQRRLCGHDNRQRFPRSMSKASQAAAQSLRLGRLLSGWEWAEDARLTKFLPYKELFWGPIPAGLSSCCIRKFNRIWSAFRWAPSLQRY